MVTRKQIRAIKAREKYKSKHIGFKGLVRKLEQEGYNPKSATRIAGAVNNRYIHHYSHGKRT